MTGLSRLRVLTGLLLSPLAGCSAAAAQPAGPILRERVDFNTGWRFQKGEPASAGAALAYENLKPWLLLTGDAFREKPAARPAGDPPGAEIVLAQPGFDDSGWRRLDLPHDWGIEGPFNQDFPGETGKLPWWGVAWYRKHFAVPAGDRDRRVSLLVEGAMSYAAVWCNGRFVGGWPYGYASWRVDLTPFLRFGADNVLAIRLDNPPESSRWYPGGGIYRDVWLEKTGPVHVAPWGVRVATPSVSRAQAKVTIETQVRNGSGAAAMVEVRTEIRRRDGGRVAFEPGADAAGAEVGAGKIIALAETFSISDPRLWSPDAPNLYVAVTRVTRRGRLLDEIETTFGIRTAEFTPAEGFHLDGGRVPLRGVCLHHDLGALGAAFNASAARRQLEILKEMGANALRTSHNPPAPGLLELCDEMGILVLDELADTWLVPKKPNGYARLFDDWSEADLRALIRRDRNHPCVIAWSLGNEVGEQRDPALQPVARRLAAIARAEDATRPTTAACDWPDAGRNGFETTVDVFGYNYKPWEYAAFRAAHPPIPLYGSETASTVSSRGEYAFPVSDDKALGRLGFQVSSYDLYAPPWAMAPDREFQGQDENPSVAGEFVWTGFDYLGEPTPFNADLTVLTNFHDAAARACAERELAELGRIRVPSRSSYFGIVDLAGFKKDRFFLYQARWRPELPMAHLLPHWNWPGREGEVTPVHVYTSGDEAELFLNGRSLGRKQRGAREYRLRWDEVRYEPGELKVVAWREGRSWATDTVKTAGPAARLVLAAERDTLAADGRELAFVAAGIEDANGVFAPVAANLLRFSVSGPAGIVATDNGDATDLVSFSSHERRAFHGRALAIVRAQRGAGGKIVVRVEADGLAPAEAVIAIGGGASGSN